MSRVLLTAALCLCTLGAGAQEQTPPQRLLIGEGAVVSDIFNVDAAYAEKTGTAIKVPFRLLAPRWEGVEMVADGAPPAGVISFVYFIEGDTPEERVFVENLRAFEATFTFAEGVPSQTSKRLRMTTAVLLNDIFPLATEGYEDVRLVSAGAVQIGDKDAAELVATYTDPSIGPMVLRIVGFPHPLRETGIVLVANMNQAFSQPVTLGEVSRTLTGHMIGSFAFLE